LKLDAFPLSRRNSNAARLRKTNLKTVVFGHALPTPN